MIIPNHVLPGFELSYDAYMNRTRVRRLSDGYVAYIMDVRNLDDILKIFRDYDAAQATPSHWMAL